ncbi:MAG TPA: histone deacetylase [Hyphomicrobiaceae bacterium]|nr:histone deacetylase [Hyphomicrobiaceae bacterium]
MQLFFPHVPPLPLPDGHRFPVGKYAMLRQAIESDAGFSRVTLTPATPASEREIALAHAPDYVAAMTSGRVSPEAMRRIGLPWSDTLIQRSRATVGGAIEAARQALRTGISGQLAGGTHHAHRDFGSGFCVFNDLAVASLAMLAEGRAGRIAIVDLDVHQGDGNAAILAGDPRVFVLSVHGEKNFPFRKVASTLDVALPDGTADAAYIAALVDALGAIEAFRPDLILYLSGADPLAADRLGRLDLTHAGLIERDRLVMELARRRGIPLSIAIGGGYADPIEESVRAYHNTFRVALEVFG